MTELTVLQAVRLKGRTTLEGLAATLDEDAADLSAVVGELAAAGLLIDGAGLRISPSGRARLNTLLAEERKGTDSAAIASAYNDFRAVNGDLKSLLTDWQLKGGPDGTPNDHDDAAYDAAVLARLDDVHARVIPIIGAVAEQVPRLSAYSTKLSAALDKIKAGDTTWLTKPLVDSYHTVWFELHEEMIVAAGLTREQAAKTGDAH